MNNVRIGDVFEYISRGKSPQYVEQSSVHVINQACIRWVGIDFSKVKYQNPTSTKKDAILSAGDLLISSTGTGTLGRCCVFDGGDENITYVADSHVTVVRKSDMMLPQFMKYYLMHDATQRELYAQCVNGSTNQIELSKEKFKKFPIPVLSKEAQQSIVATLEKIEELIALRKEQLAKLDQLVKSRFIELFGDPETNPHKWPSSKLSEFCDLQNGYAFKSQDYLDNSKVLNCRMSNIRPDGGFDAEYHPKYLPDTFWEKYKEYRLVDGDVIIAMTDMASDPKILGVPTIVRTRGHKFLLNQRVGKLSFYDNKSINNVYLMFVLSQKNIRQQLVKSAGGSTQINVGKPAVLGVEFFVPPLVLQNQFAAFVDQTDKSKLAIQQSLDKLELLKKSLMQEYFG